jgi:hypothetical protein
VPEAKIRKLVQESPTRFTLSPEQVEELRRAGASAELIAAMKKEGQAVGKGDDVGDFVLILDASGSMKERAEGGTTKWAAAQKAALDLVASIPEGRGLAFIVYGHDARRRCEAVDVLRPLGSIDAAGKAELRRSIQKLQPAGHTPIALALRTAADQLADTTGLSRVILITDGMETCHGDPEKEAAKLRERTEDRGGVDVIGFGVEEKETEAVSRIAKAGAGRYYQAESARDLFASVKAIKKQVVKAAVEEGDEEPREVRLSPRVQLLVDQLKEADPTLRENAAVALQKLKATEAAPHLARFVASDVYNTAALYRFNDKEAALKALKDLGPGEVVPALAKPLVSRDASLRTWAANQLGELEKDSREAKAAVPYLEARIKDDQIQTSPLFRDEDKDAAFKALKALAPERLEAAVTAAARSKKAEVKAWAVRKLGEVGGER